MAQEHANNTTSEFPAETEDRGGCFDFLKKKGEKTGDKDDVAVVVAQGKGGEEGNQHTLAEELHRTHSHSSSSSEEEEEVGEGSDRKKKKMGLRESIKEKLSGNKESTELQHDKCVPMEEQPPPAEEKKGFMEKIKEKLPGGNHKDHAEEAMVVEAQTPPSSTYADDQDGKEKKGIMDKIKEKLPGNHKADHESELKKKD